MISLKYGEIEATIPGSWDELNAKQLLKAVDILSSQKDLLQGQLDFIYYLLPKSLKKLMPDFTPLELLELKNQFTFLATKPKFHTWAFKKIRLPWGFRNYYGPIDTFDNLIVREYGTAEFYLKQYSELASQPNQEQRALESLNKFVATIYWPAKSGERFVPKTSTKFYSEVKKRALLFEKIPLNKKLAIAYNFAAVREFVFSQFDEAFSKSGAESKRDKYGWDGVVQHISATRHMIPDSIYNMNLLELLIQLDTMAIADKEREAQ